MLFICSQALGQFNWENFQLEVISAPASPDSSSQQFELKDKQGQIFALNFFAASPSQDAIRNALTYKDQIFSFSRISVKKLLITLEPNAAVFLLLPSKVAYQDNDLAPFLPGGITFILQDGRLYYNFRVLREQYSFKVDGAFQTEELLIEAIIKTRELQQKTQFMEQNQDELKSRLLKALQAHEPVQEKETPAPGAKLPSLYLNLFAGSGTLCGMGLDYFLFSHLSLGPLAGISYFQETESGTGKTDLISLPSGLNAKFYLLRSSALQFYIFTSGFYRFSIQNAQNDWLYGGGGGLALLDLFFAETSYFLSSKEGQLVFGLGMKFSL